MSFELDKSNIAKMTEERDVEGLIEALRYKKDVCY
jgi:hypothetical protein